MINWCGVWGVACGGRASGGQLVRADCQDGFAGNCARLAQNLESGPPKSSPAPQAIRYPERGPQTQLTRSETPSAHDRTAADSSRPSRVSSASPRNVD